MTPESPEILERLVRGEGLGWLIDAYHPKEHAIPFLLRQLEGVAVEYRRRIRVDVSFSPEALAAEGENNPHKIQAFLQTLAATRSHEMLVMVWRILQGLSIREVHLHYRELQSFQLEVVLGRSGEEQDDPVESYRSEDINDAALLRHFGIGTVDKKPLFDGYFPLLRKR